MVDLVDKEGVQEKCNSDDDNHNTTRRPVVLGHPLIAEETREYSPRGKGLMQAMHQTCRIRFHFGKDMKRP